ncbi:nuclear transport factor 2 family protein [Mycobacterium sp.]|uniref:nuclear transport factor 2 family protein n=1 Tax=Mycobacterium sp. TaxID=1785 RepID=UPI003BAD0DAC
MSDNAREIENLIYTYAERLDAGDLDGVAQLFTHGRISSMEDGPPETVFVGSAGVRQLYEQVIRRYDDGTPKTKHITTNVCINVDEPSGTAQSRSYYCVTQATSKLPLQVIVTGRYRDTFQRIDGVWWFNTRIMFVDQIGDISQHLKS